MLTLQCESVLSPRHLSQLPAHTPPFHAPRPQLPPPLPAAQLGHGILAAGAGEEISRLCRLSYAVSRRALKAGPCCARAEEREAVYYGEYAEWPCTCAGRGRS